MVTDDHNATLANSSSWLQLSGTTNLGSPGALSRRTAE